MYLLDKASIFVYNEIKEYNSQPYYYHRNLQGDVIAIYDANGEKQVEYVHINPFLEISEPMILQTQVGGNMVFRPGTVFAFYIEQENKYGIIQILHWGKAGYNIRVFYKLIDNLERKAIDLAVKTTDFYYIKDFYPFDLLNGKKVGHFVIPAFVTLPKYMRDCERKRNGELWWYVMEDSGNIWEYNGIEFVWQQIKYKGRGIYDCI